MTKRTHESTRALLLLSVLSAGCGARVVVDGEGGGGTITKAPSCAEGAPCATGLACCGDACVDVSTDPAHCGACDQACEAPNATMVCSGGLCAIGSCDPGFLDCDWQVANGCEANVPDCSCVPGDAVLCYSGPPGTEGVGVCTAGIQKCAEGAGWGPCEGQVLPAAEVCNGVDDDCNGPIDDGLDLDGDGFSQCDGDCCDTPACAAQPELVNPGAFEVPANGVDDDCDAATLDMAPYPTCSDTPLSTPTTGLDLAKAMDLCTFTTEEAKTWGVLGASLTLADGSTTVLPKDVQAGVLAAYGPFVGPLHGTTMAALSSGTARAEGDPGHVYPQNGSETAGQVGNFDAQTAAPIPGAFLAANGGKVPSACGTCDDPSCGTAFDSVSLGLRIRTPTNAESFTYFHRFYTAEYPENLCESYNDFFVALIGSKHPLVPPDGNVAWDLNLDPVSVNNVFFDVCVSGDVCPSGSLELVGTGMGGWDGLLHDGAGTSWVGNIVPIVPGEIIDLRLCIWDALDGNVDSLVLVDRFRWNLPGTGPVPPP